MRTLAGFFFLLRGLSMKFTKSPLTFQEQVDLLKTRGLIINDPEKALQNISRINYYRLSSYYVPFQINRNLFKPGTSIEKIFSLYGFDKKIRSLIFGAIEIIEVTLRTRIAYHFSHKYGPFAYSDSQYFSKGFKHFNWYTKLEGSIQISREDFIKKFFKEYDEEKNLPLWIAIEIMSFGQLSFLFRGLERTDRNNISKDCFGIDEKILSSWIHTLVYIRNLCAHHSRIWNRTLAIKPIIPNKLAEWKGISNSKIFCVFLISKRLITLPGEWKYFKNDLLHLLEEHNDIDIKRMGFPVDWKDRINSI
jgi:abortive infection bacteriophage resistance protein